MNLMASQVFYLAKTIALQQTCKAKIRKYFRVLNKLKRENIYKSRDHINNINKLTSYVYAYNQNVSHIKLMSNDVQKLSSLMSNIRNLELAIVKYINICYSYRVPSPLRRNSI